MKLYINVFFALEICLWEEFVYVMYGWRSYLFGCVITCTNVCFSVWLFQNSESTLIRPIAFKPVIPSHSQQTRYLSTPHLAGHSRISPPQYKRHDMRSRNHSQDDGYVSQDYSNGMHSHSTSNVSQGSLHIDTHATTTLADKPGPYLIQPDSHHGLGFTMGRPESHASSNLSRVSSGHPDGYIQTPSPSDSGVGDMEALLREKDAEIQQLRETMAHNEMAILKVGEEKQQNSEMEMKNLHQQWERRLQTQQQKAFKTEQALLIQLFKIQQERKTMRLDVDQLQKDKDKLEEHYKRSDDDLKVSTSKMEELQWDLCQKSGEISLLKSQLKDSMESTSNKGSEVVSLKTLIKDLRKEVSDKDAAIKQLHNHIDQYKKDLQTSRDELRSLQKESLKTMERKSRSTENLQNDSGLEFSDSHDTESLKQELTRLHQELQQRKATFDEERLQWLDEKNKVIRYQKHLQLNYVQMFRKNRQLEAEIEQLTLELENRDVNLVGEAPVEESAC